MKSPRLLGFQQMRDWSHAGGALSWDSKSTEIPWFLPWLATLPPQKTLRVQLWQRRKYHTLLLTRTLCQSRTPLSKVESCGSILFFLYDLDLNIPELRRLSRLLFFSQSPDQSLRTHHSNERQSSTGLSEKWRDHVSFAGKSLPPGNPRTGFPSAGASTAQLTEAECSTLRSGSQRTWNSKQHTLFSASLLVLFFMHPDNKGLMETPWARTPAVLLLGVTSNRRDQFRLKCVQKHTAVYLETEGQNIR